MPRLFALILFVLPVSAGIAQPSLVGTSAMTVNNTIVSQNQPESLDGILYYWSTAGGTGQELWQYDPATGASSLALDLVAGSPGSLINYLEPLGDSLYFSAYTTDSRGVELFGYDPATGTASRLTDIAPGTGHSNPSSTTALGGALYFYADDGPTTGKEPYVYDPATGLAAQIADIAPGADDSFISAFVEVGGIIYFDALNATEGEEIWAYDPGTGMVTAVTDLSAPGASASLQHLFAFDERLFFQANTGGVGQELWAYDPALGTASLVADVYPGGISGSPRDFAILGGKLYFQARGLDSGGAAVGIELFVFDPVVGTVSLAADVYPGTPSSTPGELQVIGSRLYFRAQGPTGGIELYVYDPATGAAEMAADIHAAGSSEPTFLAVHEGRLYFRGSSTTDFRGLWRFDPALTLQDAAGWRTLALPAAGLPLGGRGDGFLTNVWTAGYLGADRDQRDRRGMATVFLYDEPTGAFVTPASETSVAPGQGLWVYVYEDDDPVTAAMDGGFPKSLQTGGTAVTGEHVFSLSYTPGAPAPGLNLVGNPYDENVDWDSPGWTRTDIGSTVYVWDPEYNSGDYRTWNGTTGDLADGIIPVGQGFHVEALSASADLRVTEAAKTGSAWAVNGLAPTTDGAMASKARLSHGLHLRLAGRVGGSDRQSDVFVSISGEAALGFDASDGRRLAGLPGADALRLSALVPSGHEEAGAALAIASVPSRLGGPVEVSLHAEALADGSPADAEATLAWEATALPAGWTASLRDRATGQVHDLTEAGQVGLSLDAHDALTHTPADLPEAAKTRDPLAPPPVPQARPLRVSAHALSDARFTLVLTPDASARPAALAAEIGGVGPNPTRGAASLAVTVAESGEVTLSVYDALGRLVREGRQPVVAGTHRLAVPVGGLAPGAYVVRVEAPGGAATRRLTVVR